MEAIRYARLASPPASGQEREVQKSLMGAVIYSGKEALPRSTQWQDTVNLLLRDACWGCPWIPPCAWP